MRTQNINNKNGKVILTAVAALLVSTWFAISDARAQACGNHDTALAGSYRGKALKGRARYDLLVRPVEGRASSYLAVLMTTDARKVKIYILDAVTESTWSMTPLTVTVDGNIGVTNSNPSLVLNQMGEDCSADLMIASAQTSNASPNQNAIRFGSRSQVQWEAYTPGTYKISGNRHAGSFGPMGADTFEATVFLTAPSSGYFVLREKIPGFFTLKPNSYTDTGVITGAAPQGIGLFVSTSHLGRRTHFLLVNPNKSDDVTVLKRRLNQ